MARPTMKQRKAAQLMVDKGVGASTAMREVGYSAATAQTPGKLTQSAGFQQIMNEMGIDDHRLAEVLSEGLGATKAVVMGVNSGESFVDVTPDYQTRHKYLETGLRLKGLGKTGDISITFNQQAQEQRKVYDL